MPATIEFPTDFTTGFQSLRFEHDLGERGDAILEDLASRGFVVATGVRQEQVDRLAEMSGERHVLEYCPRDPTTRFGDEQKIAKWLSKGRVMVGIYSLSQAVDLNVGARLVEVDPEDLTQVAYAWFGQETNAHIPEADVTTAYRVSRLGSQQARERRRDDQDRFKLGYPIGELVTAVAIRQYGVEGNRMSLETWRSNGANDLYDMMGYVQRTELEDVRPTLHSVGSYVNGREVFLDESDGVIKVPDTRLFKQLADHPLLQDA